MSNSRVGACPNLCCCLLLCYCSYEFGTVDGSSVSRSLYSGSSSSYTYSSLPQGNNTLYVCVTDTLGAKACETSIAAVQPPPADFKPTDELSKLDINKVASTSDVSVAADIAASIFNYNAISKSNSGQKSSGNARGLLQVIPDNIDIISGSGSGVLISDIAQFTQTIEAKSNDLVNLLSNTLDSYVGDTQSMLTVCYRSAQIAWEQAATIPLSMQQAPMAACAYCLSSMRLEQMCW